MYYVFVFLVLLLAELMYFRVADRFNIIDRPNERSSHSLVTLRGGGIIFTIGIILYGLSHQFEYAWFMMGLIVIAGISLLDDVRGVWPIVRLLFHVVAIWLLLYQWEIYSWVWWELIVILILCIGVINVYNFMDGINGITGGYSLVVVGCLAYVNRCVTTFIEPSFIGCVLVSLLIFNWFNFRFKARCFAGDVGAVGIAFILLFLLGKLILQTREPGYLILLVVYGVDSVLTIVHRLILHENIGLPHRKHLYQLMANELHIAHPVVSLVYMLLQLGIFIGYIYAGAYRYVFFMSVLGVLTGGYCMFMRKYFKLHQT